MMLCMEIRNLIGMESSEHAEIAICKKSDLDSWINSGDSATKLQTMRMYEFNSCSLWFEYKLLCISF